MRTVLISGANRGLGSEMVKQCLRRGDRVIATCRTPAAGEALEALAGAYPGALNTIALELTDPHSIERAAAAAAALVPRIDVLINSAGINGTIDNDFARSPSGFFGRIDPAAMAHIFAVNATGPLLLIQAFAGLLQGATIVNITSSMGSMGLMNRGEWYGYRASKAALNMITRALSFDLGSGTIVVAIHPGWVKTDMGTQAAPEPLEESIASLLGLIERLLPSDTGRYFNWKGEALPW